MRSLGVTVAPARHRQPEEWPWLNVFPIFVQGFFFVTSTCFPVPLTLGASGTAATNYTTKIDWFGTVRGRIGYVWGNGNVMSYLTGGLAYGEVKLNGTNTVAGTLGDSTSFSLTQAFG